MPDAALLPEDLAYRQALAERLVVEPTPPPETTARVARAGPRGLPIVDWAGHELQELAPRLLPFPTPPPHAPGGWRDHFPLPRADVVVMTWTSAEWDALHYVFANDLEPLPNNPSHNARWRDKWYPYRRDFHAVFQTLWMRRLISASQNRGLGAPALSSWSRRWGSFCLVQIKDKRVLLFKSDLHINQDGEGLPLVQLVRQIYEDCRPELLLSVGTAGGVDVQDGLGDTVVTPAARFHLGSEFSGASFNDREYRSGWRPPTTLLVTAQQLLMPVDEYPVEPPTAHYPAGSQLLPRPHVPRIRLTDRPILTTDFFEFGTTTNALAEIGCCVEMDDAVIAMVGDELGKAYGFLRNVSDPVITGDDPDNFSRDLQTAWAVVTYQRKGLYTSFNSAMATWAMIAG